MPHDHDSRPNECLEIENLNTPNNIENGSASQKDFGLYQFVLFVITQLGYLPLAGGMLATTFFEPSRVC